MTSISTRIFEARCALRMTQAALGEACKMHPKQISHYETGSKVPGTASLAKLAAALRVSLDWLVVGERDEVRKEASEEGDGSKSSPQSRQTAL